MHLNAAYIEAFLMIPPRGIKSDDFETFMRKKCEVLERLSSQICDAQQRGAKAEVRKLKNKISSYRSRIKVRLRLEQIEIKANEGKPGKENSC